MYGSALLQGHVYTDKVCLFENSACVENFEFFLVTQQQGLSEPIDGIIGLARNIDIQTEEYTVGPLFYEYMYNADLIQSNEFSFYIPKNDLSQSYIDFGASQHEVVAKLSLIHISEPTRPY